MEPIASYEIVHFSFRPGIPFESQLEHLRQLDRWVITQPGFLWRRCFRDDGRQCWTDVVAWESRHAAVAAAERIPSEPSLAAALSSIDPSGTSFGHYTQVFASGRP